MTYYLIAVKTGAGQLLSAYGVCLYLWGKNQGMKLLPGHDELNYGRLGPESQQITNRPSA